MPATDAAKVIEGEVLSALELQNRLEKLESELAANDQFKQFISLRNSVNEKWSQVRKDIEAVMVPAYQAGEIDKTLKGEWGSITVTETDLFKVDEASLPAKFFKKVVDTAKIRATYQLEGKAPKGTTPYKRYGILTKFKGAQ